MCLGCWFVVIYVLLQEIGGCQCIDMDSLCIYLPLCCTIYISTSTKPTKHLLKITLFHEEACSAIVYSCFIYMVVSKKNKKSILKMSSLLDLWHQKKAFSTQFFVISFKSVAIQGSILSMRAALVSPCAKTPNAATMSSACRVKLRKKIRSKNVESNVIIMGFLEKIMKHHGNLSGQNPRDQKPTYQNSYTIWCSTP